MTATKIIERKRRRFRLSTTWFAWALILPAILFIAVIVAWPLLETVRLSFTNAKINSESYVGFENYAKLMESKKFHRTIIRTFYWMILSVSLKLILGLIGAALLNATVPGKALFRVLVMPPWVIPIAIGMIGWLVDGAAIMNQTMLAKCSYGPYSRAMLRICAEEGFHKKQGQEMIMRYSQGTEKQKKRRAARNKARRHLERQGRVHKGDGKDIDHKDRNPHNNSSANIRVRARSANRGDNK